LLELLRLEEPIIGGDSLYVEGQLFLCLATQILNRIGIKQELKYMLKVSFPLGQFKRLIQPIEQKQILLFGIIGNDNHVTDNPRKYLIHLNIGLESAF
jgi:hypothetical protein